MLGLIVKVSTFDDIVSKKDLHIFPWIPNIQRITVLYSCSRNKPSSPPCLSRNEVLKFNANLSLISKIIERVVKSRLTKMRTFEVFLVFKNLKT